MNKFVIAACAACAISTPASLAAKKVAPSGLQLQQIQAKDIEASKDVVFSAVMSVFQDSGYRIQAADKDTGLITAISSTNSKVTWLPFVGFGRSKKSPIASAFIEQRSPTMTNVRISFVMAKVKSNAYGSSPQDEEPIYDPTVYQKAFEQINQAVFIRLGMTAPVSPVKVEAVAPTPAAAVAVAAPTTVAPVATPAVAATPNN